METWFVNPPLRQTYCWTVDTGKKGNLILINSDLNVQESKQIKIGLTNAQSMGKKEEEEEITAIQDFVTNNWW